MSNSQTLVVVGGGAAGFFCAINAAQMSPGLRVIILEKTSKLLSKVKISGGGRCNVTHACFDVDELSKKYPRGERFVKKAFHWFHPTQTFNWFQQRGVTLKTEADGRVFPATNQSQTIIECLMQEANKNGIEIRMQATVEQIAVAENGFDIFLANNRSLHADFLCIATGGYPKRTMFDWLQKTGHIIVEPVPSLFTFNISNHALVALAGVSVTDAVVKISGTKMVQSGPLLITHWGLSGPAVLKTSAWAARLLAEKQYQFTILVNWLGSTTEQALRLQWQQIRNSYANSLMSSKNPFLLPQRLWHYFLKQASIEEQCRWANITAKQQNKLIQLLTADSIEVSGKTTFKEEFVTCGGVSTAEMNSSTMESKLLPQLFFAGEVVDVDGVTGGFNFQFAWTSGWIAAKTIAQKLGAGSD
jgi:predicted Rossmann fold flavoprotein